MEKKFSFWEFFQGLGKTFMLPIALLGMSGIFLGVGSSLSGAKFGELVPLFKMQEIRVVLQFLTMIGLFTFKNLAVLFAMAIPLGLVRDEKGVAAFSGFVGYSIMNMGINFYLKTNNLLVPANEMRTAGQSFILGIQTIETGVLGGIIVGIIVYFLHEKFKEIKLPDALSFFGGVRFVPIITLFTLSLVGALIIPKVWPMFNYVINGIGYIIKTTGLFGAFIFGACERLLIPLGLHHILTAMIRFTPVGGEAIINGEIIYGALNIFYEKLALGQTIEPSLTALLSQGRTPSFFFGLPAVALAIYHTAKEENKGKIKGLLISGVLAAIVGGITEPIEFIFLFVSPILYLFHAIMTGLGYFLFGALGVTIGPGADIISYFVFGVLQGLKTKWYLILIVGPLWFSIYYFVFKWAIIKWNLKTPGREKVSIKVQDGEKKGSGISDYMATTMLEGLGGASNIVSIDNCVTRLRLVLNDSSIINEDLIKEAGAIAVVKLDEKNIQVIIGPQVQVVRKKLERVMV